MPNTLGFHLVIGGYGLWLPGDDRGHWSTAWDRRIGYVEPHHLHEGDPTRQRMAAELMKHPPTRLSGAMMSIVAQSIGKCEAESEWQIAAASIEPTHIHLLLTYSRRPIDNTVKWLKDQATKAVHRGTCHDGPVWSEGKWRSYIFSMETWENTTRYIEYHNERRGEGPCPYDFITRQML